MDYTNVEIEASRRKLYSLLGELPENRDTAVKYELCSREEREQYTLERLVLHLNGIEPVPAYFLKPKGIEGKAPVILYNHAHGGNYANGKDELITGASYLKAPFYGETLAKEGYAVLCTDAWGFGERRGRTETQLFKGMLWQGRVLWGMMVYDSIRALDYLETRSDVDMDRVGTMGISMGGTMSWWLSALDTRVKVCIDMCSMTDAKTLVEKNGLDGHGVYYYVPRLLKHFSTAQINALIAPRPHMSMNGKYDVLTPYEGFEKIDTELKKVYERFDAKDAWHLNQYSIAHYETSEMKAEALSFLRKWL